MTLESSVDVLVIGAGPVGLLIAYQVLRAGCSVYVIDKDDKYAGAQYGRANAIYARSAELLDQLGLADDIVQQSHFVREAYTYDDKGERVIPGRVWNFVENVADTKFDFGLMLRQRYIEECLRDSFAALGGKIHDLTECVRLEYTNDPADGVTATVKDIRTAAEYTVKSKYLVGADGGQSFVRRYLNIPFEGERTEDQWIRIDGKVKCNIPTPRAYASIESLRHGNVLWAPLDRGVTRVGYVYTSELRSRYGGKVTEEIAIREAIEAVKPFELEFERVDWWTLYIIGQRVAATYQPHSRIVLVGDACHTHSSGAAQGLNTGIHDACNLGWKLVLVLRGLAKDDLLATYGTERRAAAQRLIGFDRKISTLMANKWPEGMKRPADKDINQVLADLFDDAKGYNTGLGISYEENLINVQGPNANACSGVAPGARVPDLDLLKPGTLEVIRLHAAAPNRAVVYILAFVGDPRITLPSIAKYSAAVDTSTRKFARGVVQTVTVVALANNRIGVEEALGCLPGGKVYYDKRSEAHRRFGVDLRYGALLVLRPDGHVGFTTKMGADGVDDVEAYLKGFLVDQ
ncbi:2,4-dichlorophenol 6-monooxygenase [Exophiala viscosa]|uniref:2,4-dichlorophenol 6-monooxygenase n=1 Tax=Exophiala viscosa TaxID=2486360 RepID=UPI00219FD7FC|nr:2,4-dichlorophenol 6-monooxygenase [Exophiala viscosa]